MTGRRGSTAVVAKRQTDTPIETDEIRGLCEAAGVEVVGERTQARPRDPTYDLGDGAVADVAELVERRDADLVVVDDHLDPGRAYNLEAAVGAEVVDRARLVLDIFGERAETRRARLEVELAELRYELPRAQARVERGESQGRQGFRSGGERPAAQLKADYRQRIKDLEAELDGLDDADDGLRAARRESGFDLVALAGYTNAGKSTLLRRLADDLAVDENEGHGDRTETAASRDRLFETLNTTTRRATVGERRVLLTDTVGFVSDLPDWLVSSFRTTLAAAREADAVLLVVDATDSEDEIREKVETSLDELADAEGTLVPVLNKQDAAGDDLDAKRRLLADRTEDSPVVTSATENDGLDDLRDRLTEALPDRERVSLSVPNTDDGNGFLSWCHDHGTVHDPSYGERIAFDFEARPEVAAKAEGRADQLGGD
ncbi:GTPase HflX [Halobacterium rubrum]|uniref:GTPase HflX n=1 Tax=Halobacterium TaxID=2239 RepID=UPI001F02C03A|nr:MULTISPECIES: GTPase HflX [Halobacterium]MDH5020514.1 GTPase HflX [Halobacterium rubrum]